MPPRKIRQRLGDFGESAAAAYLTRLGYTILAHQWRCSSGEVDLIARLDEQLVFVEVRTRRGTVYGSPEESITSVKQQRMIAVACTYLQAHGLEDAAWRLDLVAVEIDTNGRVRRLEHIPNAVEG